MATYSVISDCDHLDNKSGESNESDESDESDESGGQSVNESGELGRFDADAVMGAVRRETTNSALDDEATHVEAHELTELRGDLADEADTAFGKVDRQGAAAATTRDTNEVGNAVEALALRTATIGRGDEPAHRALDLARDQLGAHLPQTLSDAHRPS